MLAHRQHASPRHGKAEHESAERDRATLQELQGQEKALLRACEALQKQADALQSSLTEMKRSKRRMDTPMVEAKLEELRLKHTLLQENAGALKTLRALRCQLEVALSGKRLQALVISTKERVLEASGRRDPRQVLSDIAAEEHKLLEQEEVLEKAWNEQVEKEKVGRESNNQAGEWPSLPAQRTAAAHTLPNAAPPPPPHPTPHTPSSLAEEFTAREEHKRIKLLLDENWRSLQAVRGVKADIYSRREYVRTRSVIDKAYSSLYEDVDTADSSVGAAPLLPSAEAMGGGGGGGISSSASVGGLSLTQSEPLAPPSPPKPQASQLLPQQHQQHQHQQHQQQHQQQQHQQHQQQWLPVTQSNPSPPPPPPNKRTTQAAFSIKSPPPLLPPDPPLPALAPPQLQLLRVSKLSKLSSACCLP